VKLSEEQEIEQVFYGAGNQPIFLQDRLNQARLHFRLGMVCQFSQRSF
jgi:hypothetical protein